MEQTTKGKRPFSFFGKSRFSVILSVLFLSALLAAETVWVIQYCAYHAKQVIALPGGSPVTIYIDPDDPAVKAAAQYLAYAIEQKTGTEAEIAPVQDDEIRGICISYGHLPERTGHRANSLFTSATYAANVDENRTYSIELGENSLHIQIANRKDCFGSVRAVADRWLQEDSGLKGDSGLTISRAMIDRQLSGLETEVTGKLRILTQNLRNNDDGEGLTVKERSARLFQLIEENQPDLIGTQECTWEWLQLLQNELSDRYELFGCSRLGTNTHSGEWNAVLYRKDRFTFRGGDTFWLSNTPSTEASKLNYNGSPRICTWVLLQDSETEKEFLFGTTHLHHHDSEFYRALRARQAEILLRKLHGYGDIIHKYPGFLTGDFNGEPNEPFYPVMTELFEDSRTTAIDDSSTITYSYHDYGQRKELLDYCFHSPNNTTILDYHILDDQYHGYISDHYGILVTAVLN